MEIISSKRFILLILAISGLLTSNIFCTDELRENYSKYSGPRECLRGVKERNLHLEELKDRGPKDAIKMNSPTVNKMPHGAANLPLRFGRTMDEKRRPGSVASLPLRFGRNMEASSWRRVPNLPQRFGRMTAAGSGPQRGLLQQSRQSPSAQEVLHFMTGQPQETQEPHTPKETGIQENIGC